MKTAADILREFGLRQPPAGKDRYYATCPKCSAQRSRAHQKAECLGITIDDKGVQFGCNHCGWTGGKYFNGKANGKDHDPVIATFEYTDEIGAVLFRKPKTAAKKYWQERPDGRGGWIKGLGDVERVLYRLPELTEAIANGHVVFVVEGEKDVESLRSIGVPATCNPEGASEPGKKPKWKTKYSERLRDADIVIIPDHDPPGYAHAEAIASMSAGITKSVHMLKLAEHWLQCPEHGDVSDWLAAGHDRAEFDALVAQAKPWTQSDAKTTSDPPLSFLNIAAWRGQPVPEREWTVKDRIPRNNVTLLSGEGSVGKSILSLQLAVAVVLGRDWLGALPEPGPALVVCCEDDADELWRRLDRIFSHYSADCGDIKNLHVLALAGQEALMATPERNGLMQPTKLFGNIREAAIEIRPQLIVLDNAADVYGGNENDRAQVRQFIGLLRGMAMAARAGLLLTSHPSLMGISTGTGLSGSTAWNASVRSRLYFRHAPKEKDEDDPDPDLRVLEVMKSNYGPIGDTIMLRWNDGLFVPVGGISSLERAVAEQAAEQMFLTLLDQFNRQGRNTSAKPYAPNYAPTLFGKEKQAKQHKIRKSSFETAMRSLFAADKIGLESYGAPSRGTSKLVRK